MTRRWLVASCPVVSAIVAACGLAGCAPPEATFRSKANLANAAPVQRLLVVVDVHSPAFEPEVYRGFHIGLTRRLGACGVASRVLPEPDAREPVAERRIADAASELQPSAVMSMALAGVPLVHQTIVGSHTMTQNTIVFAFQLEDRTSRQVVWNARSQLEFSVHHSSDDARTGLRFATSLVSRLRDDGVLRGCPSAGWPAVDVSRTCAEMHAWLRDEANVARDPDLAEEIRFSLLYCD